MKKFFSLALLVIVIDQVSKYLVTASLNVGQTVPIIPDIFHITYIRNPGAAFGILPNQRLFFILVTLAVITVLIVYARQMKHHALLQIAFGLQLGGAAGNLIDRLFHGPVVDFLDFRFWPVFNIADSAIVIGVGLFALDLFVDWRGERSKHGT
ncbi:MAG: signal peptidase II [Firmicutes bacterium]|nr:signal peptidase II [Bacillota bacterium]